jgi:hypothetical protein
LHRKLVANELLDAFFSRQSQANQFAFVLQIDVKITSLYHRDQGDSDGSFLMSPLFPGRYTLLAIENGWDLEWSDPDVLFRYLPTGQPVVLAPGASLTLNAKVQ